MKKTYVKPDICNVNDIQGIVPLGAVAAGVTAIAAELAPAAALVGGYAVGRGVKQLMEARPDRFSNCLVSVIE